MDPRTISLSPLILRAVETLMPAATAKAITISTSLDEDAGSVTGDPDRLQQVIWNLVSNAIKFTPKHGRVDVRLRQAPSHVELVVRDNGIGINRQFLPHVFDRFRQADSSSTRSYGGLGLGLAIVRHLVELHGGTVSAESDGEGQGALFTISLPAAVQPEVLAPTSPELVESSNGKEEVNEVSELLPGLSGLRVLVVDDEPDTLDILCMVLSRYGAAVRAADSGTTAWQTFLEWKPQVLVSDLGMPLEDGFELIRKIRTLTPEDGGDTPAAALTAYVREEDRLRALAAGYQAHISKPVDPVAFATMISNLAGGSEKDQSASAQPLKIEPDVV
jgi:CheY-like chemotaxis protein/anti-sigma regulatory factor (Ser/Thr protein kinase)